MDERERIANEISEWIAKDLKYIPAEGKPMPGPADFRKLCRGNMSNVWKFLLKHVHSEQITKEIRQNIQLQKAEDDAKVYSEDNLHREKLVEKREELRKQLDEIKYQTSRVKTETHQLLTDMSNEESELTELEDLDMQLRQHKVLLQSYAKKAEAMKSVVGEYQRRIHTNYNPQRFQKSESQDAAFYSGRYDASSSPQLNANILSNLIETSVERRVREMCEKLHEKIASTNKMQWDKLSSMGYDLPHPLPDHSVSLVKEVLEVYDHELEKTTPKDMMTAVADLTIKQTNQLRKDTDAIDLKKDAEQLRMQYEGGKLKSDSPSPLQNVYQLLQEQRDAHIDRYVSAEEALNEADSLNDALEQVLNKQRMHDDGIHDQDSDLKFSVLRELQDKEIRLSGLRSACNVMDSRITELQEAEEEKEKGIELLKQQHDKIQQFNRRNSAKQTLIKKMIEDNMALRKKFQTEQQHLRVYLNGSLSSAQNNCSHFADELMDIVKKELEGFHRMPWNMVVPSGCENRFEIKRPTLADTSIYKINHPPAVLRSLQKLAHIPHHNAFEAMCGKLVKMKRDVDGKGAIANMKKEAMKTALDADKTQFQTINGDKTIEDLCERVRVTDEVAGTQWLPALQAAISDAKKAMDDSVHVKEIGNEWWTQPAQYLLPEYKVEGENMSQWLAKLRTLSMQLHEE
eukprot:GFYU01004534.1.p1 GENE.GFYU01004534.1~~GFYU01004534.1.p1  ORF type:complete len:685 (+),score=180.05 GFYU01004534.1:322-2376(+)